MASNPDSDPNRPKPAPAADTSKPARRLLKRLSTPVVVLAAALYFLIDAVFLALLRPLAVRLARLPVFVRVMAWVATLGPYPTLVLFLVPIVLLEPVKPIGAYLIGTGHVIGGLVLLAVAELLKVTIVERLFHMSRDKLLTIRWFAWLYVHVTHWLDWLKALPAWQAVVRRARRVKAAVRRLVRLAIDRVAEARGDS